MGKIKRGKSLASKVSHPYIGNSDKETKKPLSTPKSRYTKTSTDDDIKPKVVTMSSVKKITKSKSKKERVKEKSKKWKDKMDNLNKAKQVSEARQDREETKITGDMKPLSDELTSILSDIMGDKTIKLNQSTANKPNSSPYNSIMSHVNQFQAVLSSPRYQENPLSAIKRHILISNSMDRT